MEYLPVKITKVFILASVLISASGCMRYLTHDRNRVLLDGVDIDQTLKVAEVKMKERNGRLGTSLPVWVIRDQHINPEQAEVISGLYFKYIGDLKKDFDRWHLTWAIANIYRHGNDSIKLILSDAHRDASLRAGQIKGIAERMVNGEKIYMGDAHSGGRAFARNHVVVPGNKKYLQSFEEFRK